MPIPPPWNPSNQQYGIYPTYPNKPTQQVGVGPSDFVGYIRGVMHFKAGHPLLSVAANPGPWYFTSGTGTSSVQQAIKDLQTYLGLTVDGICGPQTWPWVDWLATH